MKVTEQTDDITKAEEMVVDIKIQLKQGADVLPTPVESVLEKFFCFPSLLSCMTLEEQRKTGDTRHHRGEVWTDCWKTQELHHDLFGSKDGRSQHLLSQVERLAGLAGKEPHQNAPVHKGVHHPKRDGND